MESLDIGYDDDRFTTAVDQDLHCAICLNILNAPLQCQLNEHYFCTACIKRHLNNSQTCPICMEELTFATLKKPSRFLAKSLSELDIRCDYVDRGCSEVVVLADLKTHLVSCGFSPVQCSNEGCTEVVNKREKLHHESKSCQFRELRCNDCRVTRKQIDEMKLRLGRLEDQMSRLLPGMNDQTRAIATSSPRKMVESEGDVIVVGGRNENRLSSAEMFSWSNRAWVQLPSMTEVRSAAASVVYENKVIVTGGRCNDTHDSGAMESLELENAAPERWFCVSAPKMPCKMSGHRSLVYKDRLFVIGGCDDKRNKVFDRIYEIFLTPPYSSKLVHRIPQHVCYHGAERFGNNIYIVGGSTTAYGLQLLYDWVTDQVIRYDVNTQECTVMPALPYPVRNMATVSWQNNIMVIGGSSGDGEALDAVVMYDVESGKSKLLPSMKYKRQGCTAVVSDNMIVVMGGADDRGYLNAVESFSFDRYCWEELPSMIEPRSFATAVVKCGNFV